MLLKIHNDNFAIQEEIRDKCGDEYTFFERIRKNNFGSHRYRLKKMTPTNSEIDLDSFNDNIFLNFDLRKNGLTFYFRFKNTEYVEFCAFNSLTFQSSDSIFLIQTDKYSYDFEIMNMKKHKQFIMKLYELKNKKKYL